MFPLKLLSFALKAYVAIFIHLYKIDILNIRGEKGSSLDSNISTFVVASCVACMLSKVNLSPHFQSISNMMVFAMEAIVTIYGTESIMYLIWLPLLKGLLWMSTKIGKTFTKSRYKLPVVDDVPSCIESDLFCYLNICLALFIASNTLASFDCVKNFRTLWPSTLMSRGGNIMSPKITTDDVITEIMADTAKVAADQLNVNPVVRPKRRPILLMNVRWLLREFFVNFILRCVCVCGCGRWIYINLKSLILLAFYSFILFHTQFFALSKLIQGDVRQSYWFKFLFNFNLL